MDNALGSAPPREGVPAPAPFARPPLRRYYPGVVRVLLVLMLVHGLVPGLAEAGEALLHYARTGHVAHTAADEGDLGDQGAEHGCGTTQHRCTCCATQVVVSSADVVIASLEGGAARPIAPSALTLAARAPARPFRPPIS